MAVLAVSYARPDQHRVRGLVKLIRLAEAPRGGQVVFWDDDIEPGELWDERIRTEIKGARKLLVFWCSHASRSDYVEQEYRYAQHLGKPVIPVLMDDTPLADALARINGLDLHEHVSHGTIGLNGLAFIPAALFGGAVAAGPDALSFGVPMAARVAMAVIAAGVVAALQRRTERRRERDLIKFISERLREDEVR